MRAMPQSHSLLNKYLLVTGIVFSVLIPDFISKQFIVTTMMPHETIEVLPFLRIVNVRNEGAAFGLFTHLGNRFFIIISLIAILLIAVYIKGIRRRLELYSLSFILGGAIGNLTDRLRIGKVIDFIDIFIGSWHWPAFNVADSALTIGIILFILSSMRCEQESEAP